MAQKEHATIQDRFRGALLGTFVGDALGMPVEGQPASRSPAATDAVRDMLPARLGRGTYTDDTQMTLALAEALIETPDNLDEDRIARRFGVCYEPERGYGGNTHRILAAIQAGEPWREVTDRFSLPGGSFANGAAMRVAPIALAFFHQPDRIKEASERQAAITAHTHPIGLFGAFLQAYAVWNGLAYGPSWSFEAFIETTHPEAPEPFAAALDWIRAHQEASPDQAIEALGTGSRASASVPAALWAFVTARDSFEESVIRAVNLGGDADTIGAMTGAIAGAAHGTKRFPRRWTEALENSEQGRDYLIRLADRLFDLTHDSSKQSKSHDVNQ